MDRIKWPLPKDHAFGVPMPGTLKVHAGNEMLHWGSALKWWQHTAKLKGYEVTPTGLFDGDTQRLALRLQRDHALPQTERLDQGTWEALYSARPLESSVSPVEGSPRWYRKNDPEASTGALRALLGLPREGGLTDDVRRRLRGLQRLHGLAQTGELDTPTARAVDKTAPVLT